MLVVSLVLGQVADERVGFVEDGDGRGLPDPADHAGQMRQPAYARPRPPVLIVEAADESGAVTGQPRLRGAGSGVGDFPDISLTPPRDVGARIRLVSQDL
ncbi:hypothetical protein [Streptomonospora wellingtoniae]|uniref:Uncharacterized protein n=1 Tax=Streptomonospora wellingtoniae TaxID=3075544 RepID=A0ABU2L0W5_9ACTN|nr:hypothetical protein [Streptomonospora sp. DSM 45055]MDT0305199.1 hypothetical protein [Streptomonospora sp. DSM 45055]